jgi:hypothetical protein
MPIGMPCDYSSTQPGESCDGGSDGPGGGFGGGGPGWPGSTAGASDAASASTSRSAAAGEVASLRMNAVPVLVPVGCGCGAGCQAKTFSETGLVMDATRGSAARLIELFAFNMKKVSTAAVTAAKTPDPTKRARFLPPGRPRTSYVDRRVVARCASCASESLDIAGSRRRSPRSPARAR